VSLLKQNIQIEISADLSFRVTHSGLKEARCDNRTRDTRNRVARDVRSVLERARRGSESAPRRTRASVVRTEAEPEEETRGIDAVDSETCEEERLHERAHPGAPLTSSGTPPEESALRDQYPRWRSFGCCPRMSLVSSVCDPHAHTYISPPRRTHEYFQRSNADKRPRDKSTRWRTLSGREAASWEYRRADRATLSTVARALSF